MSNGDISVIDHLAELRKRIIICLIFIIVIAAAIYNKIYYLINLLMMPIKKYKFELAYFSITDGFITRVQLSLFLGIVLSSPVIIYQLAAFINPGLTKREKKFVYLNVLFISMLFLIGFAFGYILILPHTLSFLITYGSTYMTPLLAGRTYFSFIGIFCLYVGLAFIIPYALILLGKLSLLSSKTLRKWRKYVWIVTLIIEGTLLPAVDIITFITATAPVILLYELSIWIIYFMERLKKKKQKTNA